MSLSATGVTNPTRTTTSPNTASRRLSRRRKITEVQGFRAFCDDTTIHRPGVQMVLLGIKSSPFTVIWHWTVIRENRNYGRNQR